MTDTTITRIICTPLMCVPVATILPPRQQALLRSSGTTGASAYTEVVALRSSVSMWVETDSSNSVQARADGVHYEVEGDCVPVTHPLPLQEEDTLVLRGTKLERRNVVPNTNTTPGGVGVDDGGESATIGRVPVYPMTRVRYEGDPNIVEIGGLDVCTQNSHFVASSIQFVGFDNVKAITNNYLHECSLITSWEMKCSSSSDNINNTGNSYNITSVGERFMARCWALISVDISPLSNVTTIGNEFMFLCIFLPSIDLGPLSKVTSIGNAFLGDCGALTTIDLGPLATNLISVGEDFMIRCSRLEEVTLGGAESNNEGQLILINDRFFEDCTALTSINLRIIPSSSGTSHIPPTSTTPPDVGEYFLCYCTSLVHVDLSPLSNITFIGEGFMESCSSLTSIDLSPLVNVTTVGMMFMHCCSSLVEVDLKGLDNVTRIGACFMNDCTSITSINLTPLSQITEAGKFMCECTSLKSIDISALRNCAIVSDIFLTSCSSLTTIDLSPLSNIVSVGRSFLSDCSDLKSIDLAPLSNVTQLGDLFMSNCSSLTSIDLSPLSRVTVIGEMFLAGCSSIKNNSEEEVGGGGVDISPLRGVVTVGAHFMQDTFIQPQSVANTKQFGSEMKMAIKTAMNRQRKAALKGGSGCTAV